MKAAVDVSAAGNPVGVGTYAAQLARHLPAAVPEGDALTLFWSFRPGRAAPPLPPLPPSVRTRGWCIPGRVLAPLWRAGLPPSADLLSGHPDVFHSTSFLAPTVRRARLVLTLHSPASHLLADASEGPPPGREELLSLLRRARILLCVSKFVEDDLRETLGAPLPAVRVIPLAVDPDRFRPRTPEEAGPVLSGLGLRSGDYLLAVGALRPWKNAGRLLQAWSAIPDGRRPRLVWAGSPFEPDPGLREAIRQAVPRGFLWLPHPPTEALPALYAGAIALCYPSLYEGFGLPILEAMSSGIPVLTSGTGAMPEVAGEAALIVDPYSVESIREGLDRLLADAPLRLRLSTLGRLRASGFRWDVHARSTWDAYREAVS